MPVLTEPRVHDNALGGSGAWPRLPVMRIRRGAHELGARRPAATPCVRTPGGNVRARATEARNAPRRPARATRRALRAPARARREPWRCAPHDAQRHARGELPPRRHRRQPPRSPCRGTPPRRRASRLHRHSWDARAARRPSPRRRSALRGRRVGRNPRAAPRSSTSLRLLSCPVPTLRVPNPGHEVERAETHEATEREHTV